MAHDQGVDVEGKIDRENIDADEEVIFVKACRHVNVKIQKTYKCQYCEKSFSHGFRLKDHWKRVHSGEKPHKCNECNKAFNRAYVLRDHILTHTSV